MPSGASRRSLPPMPGAAFDVEKHMASINAADPLRVVLDGHLYIEAALTALIEAVMPFPDDLPVAKESFDRKVRLALALGILHLSEAGAYRAPNDLRKDMAHGLPPHVTVGQVDELIGIGRRAHERG